MSPTSCQTAPPRARGPTVCNLPRRTSAEREDYGKSGHAPSTQTREFRWVAGAKFFSFRKLYSDRMSELQVLQTVALASLLAWASGLRLYLVVFVVGLAAYYGVVNLPDGLKVLAHPYVIGAAGFLLTLEFLADKFPGVDSAWDGIQ